MKKLCNICVRGVHFLLTTLLKPALLLAILSWNQKYFEGWLPGLIRASWALLPGYGALFAHISWLLIHAGVLTSLQLGHASLESGSLIFPTHEWEIWAWDRKGQFWASLPAFPWRCPAGLSSWERTCYLWLLLLLFPTTLGMRWREH